MTSWISRYFFTANVHSSSSSAIASFHRPTSSLKVSIFLSTSSSFSRYRSMASSFLSKLSNARSIVLAHAACNCACGILLPDDFNAANSSRNAEFRSLFFYSWLLRGAKRLTTTTTTTTTRVKAVVPFVTLITSPALLLTYSRRLCSLLLRHNTSMHE